MLLFNLQRKVFVSVVGGADRRGEGPGEGSLDDVQATHSAKWANSL